jgi:hypothetical protein
MRKLLVVVSLLVVGSAYGQPVYEDPLDDAVGGWGANATSPYTEGGRTYSKISDFNNDITGGAPPWWFFAANRYVGVLDISSAPRFEVDVRIHQEAPADSWLGVRLGTWNVELYGEYFHGWDGAWPPDPTNPSGVNLCHAATDPHDEWITVGFDLSLAVDAGMDLTQFDGFEFFGGYAGTTGNASLDYFDIDNAVFTPEPSSLMLLGLGFVAVMRRR